MSTRIFNFGGVKYLAVKNDDAYKTVELKSIDQNGYVTPLVRKRHVTNLEWNGNIDSIKKEYYVSPNNWNEYSLVHKRFLTDGGMFRIKTLDGRQIVSGIMGKGGKVESLFGMYIRNGEYMSNNVKQILRKIGESLLKIK